jgi:predicted DNA-binding protein (MmcQ/YjbR family)
MNHDQLLAYCLKKPGAWEDMPWEGDLVVKVAEKIFIFLGDTAVGPKWGDNPPQADEWLARHPDDASVMAYIGRSGWNTLRINRGIPDDEIFEAIEESYARVVRKLPKGRRPQGWDHPSAP